MLLLTTLVLRRASVNRHIRGKLRISAALFAAYGLAAASLVYAPLPSNLAEQIRAVGPLLLAFGLINLLVNLVINPWRVDHVPERFPNIVQDAIIIALFALAATFVLEEKMIGFALQDTLGNLFAGWRFRLNSRSASAIG